MKNLTYYIFVFFVASLHAQNEPFFKLSEFVITPEIMLGNSAEANDLFPDRDMQKQFVLGLGRNNKHNTKEWAYWLKAPKTGIILGYTDLGNSTQLGESLTLMPYIEFDAFGKWLNNLSVLLGMGTSYFNVKYDPETNFYNQAVTTDFTWSFRAGLHYAFLKRKKIDYRLGLVYSHHSNGHTYLPNQGLNSFLVSFSADVKNPFNRAVPPIDGTLKAPEKSVYQYLSLRYGSGINVFAFSFNDTKNIFTLAGEYGKVWNKTYKIGLGFYYRFYEHYYDYIKGNESLVQEGKEFEDYKNNPRWNASNLGVFINCEFLLNHFGIDLQLGANLFKPGYKIDWRINEGWDYPPRELPDNWVLGEYTSKYKLKQLISSRMGMKYYLLGTDRVPRHNVFISAHINANLGQADFSEVSLGYVLSLKN